MSTKVTQVPTPYLAVALTSQSQPKEDLQQLDKKERAKNLTSALYREKNDVSLSAAPQFSV